MIDMTTPPMKSLTIHGVEVHEWDEVRLTGVCCSWGEQRMEDVTGVVGTVSVDDEPAVKVWPHEDLGDGKLWFAVKDIEKLEVTQSGGEE